MEPEVPVAEPFELEGGEEIDEETCGCDCDEDGVDSIECGGDDCDDLDGRVFPGQTEYFFARAPNENIGFDYDCSGSPEKDPAQSEPLDCGAIGALCSGSEGFIGGWPGCGLAGTWGECQKGLVCQAVPLDTELLARCH